MPSFQNIVLPDAATPTPVNHTFTPSSNQDGRAVVSEAGTTKIGEPRLEIEPMLNRGAGRKFITNVLLVVPVTQQRDDNGITSPVIVRTAVVDAKFSFDQASTLQERKDIIAMFRATLDPTKPLLYDSLTKVETIWGG